jgi:hypothetical protein
MRAVVVRFWQLCWAMARLPTRPRADAYGVVKGRTKIIPMKEAILPATARTAGGDSKKGRPFDESPRICYNCYPLIVERRDRSHRSS